MTHPLSNEQRDQINSMNINGGKLYTEAEFIAECKRHYELGREQGALGRDSEVLALQEQLKHVQAAARAVVERWDSPKWKDFPHTGEFIYALRKAIEL